MELRPLPRADVRAAPRRLRARRLAVEQPETHYAIRAGLHTGEIELAGVAVRGVAVHIGARVASEVSPSEVLVSSTVRDLVAGSGIEFVDRGARVLKGVPGEWRLYRAASPRDRFASP